ncbi:MAG: DedA family protein [bacterium]|nr:DedA family protein [bacterium]
MDHFLNILQHNDEVIRRWGYIIFFGASWIEGFNSMIFAGFIASLGKLNIFLVIPLITVGHSFSGFSWYAVGFFGGASSVVRWGKYLRISNEHLEEARTYFERHGGKAIVITKFTVGFTIATLILAGTLKMRLKKFAVYNLLGSAIWACLTGLFGYTFGLSFKLLTHYIESLTYLVVFFFIFLAGAIGLWYVLRAIFRTSLLRAISEGLTSLVKLGSSRSKKP